MEKKKLELFRNLGCLVEQKKMIPMSDQDWENQQKEIASVRKENKKIAKSISMSKDKFHQSFSL